MVFPCFHAVAQVRPDQAGEFRRAALQRFQEQSSVGKLVFVRRVRQQLHGLGVGGFFFRRIAGKVHALEGVLIGKEEAIVEGEFGVDAVAQRDVAEFVRQGHRQTKLHREERRAIRG